MTLGMVSVDICVCVGCNSSVLFAGTKHVAKRLKPIAVGAAKRAGVTWYPDKSIENSSIFVFNYVMYIQERAQRRICTTA